MDPGPAPNQTILRALFGRGLSQAGKPLKWDSEFTTVSQAKCKAPSTHVASTARGSTLIAEILIPLGEA
jgi:hypothetical protein